MPCITRLSRRKLVNVIPEVESRQGMPKPPSPQIGVRFEGVDTPLELIV